MALKQFMRDSELSPRRSQEKTSIFQKSSEWDPAEGQKALDEPPKSMGQ